MQLRAEAVHTGLIVGRPSGEASGTGPQGEFRPRRRVATDLAAKGALSFHGPGAGAPARVAGKTGVHEVVDSSPLG